MAEQYTPVDYEEFAKFIRNDLKLELTPQQWNLVRAYLLRGSVSALSERQKLREPFEPHVDSGNTRGFRGLRPSVAYLDEISTVEFDHDNVTYLSLQSFIGDVEGYLKDDLSRRLREEYGRILFGSQSREEAMRDHPSNGTWVHRCPVRENLEVVISYPEIRCADCGTESGTE